MGRSDVTILFKITRESLPERWQLNRDVEEVSEQAMCFLLGAALGITDKTEAQPQTPLLIP